jgi:hypothetical protein
MKFILVLLSIFLIGCSSSSNVRHSIQYKFVSQRYDFVAVIYIGDDGLSNQTFIVKNRKGWVILVKVRPGKKPKIVQDVVIFKETCDWL